MSYSFTQSFTRTHAREIASRVAADLRLMLRYYGEPSIERIDQFEQEFVELLVAGYLKQIEYGFKRSGSRVVTLRYTVVPGVDEPQRAGSVFATADTTGASFFSFLEYNAAFDALSASQQAAVEATLPIVRTTGTEPGNGSGYWVSDKTYAAGGVAASRRMFRPAA